MELKAAVDYFGTLGIIVGTEFIASDNETSNKIEDFINKLGYKVAENNKQFINNLTIDDRENGIDENVCVAYFLVKGVARCTYYDGCCSLKEI